ncbi:hypothetical protein GA0111570_104156 [Raineyella antarctica]|uniref:Rhomboid family protein n=1 Tax=Raineyella antarctica TaxID=1577474 RepID=A0A1G6GNP1_9ACTN|nr:rhomboid-like protein [Raineyella antarctica]SDB83544.1 hypothetical protein GA0111570_104156 [Raineyella antarctica]
MVLLILVLVAVALSAGLRHGWRWTLWLRRQWRRVQPPVWTWVRSAPLTYGYLGLLGFTTWLLVRTRPALRTEFLAAQSTNLHQLSINPVGVLLRSAFYVTPLELAGWLVAFTLVLAPLERWVGRWRMLAGFWTGHVGATLLTAAVIAWSVSHHRVPAGISFSVDVGASYGFMALLAMAGYWFTGWLRWVWAVGFTLVWGAPVIAEPNFTNAGHLVAFLLGLAMYPVVRSLPPQAMAARGWRHRPGH